MEPLWSLSAIDTNNSRSSSRIVSPDRSKPSFSSTALKVPSRSLSKRRKALTSSTCSCPFISDFFLSISCKVLIDQSDELEESELFAILDVILPQHLLDLFFCGLVAEPSHRFSPFLHHRKPTCIEMLPFPSVSNSAKISNSSLNSCRSYMFIMSVITTSFFSFFCIIIYILHKNN